MTKSELILEQFRRYANSADIMSKLHSREILSGYGNSELNCIDCIGRMKHPNAARIADEMDLTRSAVSKILRKLIAKDAAISYQLPGNQKEIYYKLTPYGRELFRQHRLRHLNWGKKDEEIPQVDKDRKSEYHKTIADLNKQKNSLLEEYGKGNKVVGQLIDLALLANGLLKGEALNRFVKRSVELIK